MPRTRVSTTHRLDPVFSPRSIRHCSLLWPTNNQVLVFHLNQAESPWRRVSTYQIVEAILSLLLPLHRSILSPELCKTICTIFQDGLCPRQVPDFDVLQQVPSLAVRVCLHVP